MLWGLLWIVGVMVIALKPEGCIGADCSLPGRSMRSSSAVDAVLFIAAVLLIGLGITVAVTHATRTGRFGTLGFIGVVCSALGLVLLASGLMVQAVFFGGDFRYMPLVVVPAGLALVIGHVLLCRASTHAYG
jgi:hypothetical protein